VAQKLYVGNLSYNVSSSDLQQLFAQHGTVRSAEVIMDRDTGRPRGFAFVEMNNADATRAIQSLKGFERGLKKKVTESKLYINKRNNKQHC
jgi:RNA recognition motif-containing protein